MDQFASKFHQIYAIFICCDLELASLKFVICNDSTGVIVGLFRLLLLHNCTFDYCTNLLNNGTFLTYYWAECVQLHATAKTGGGGGGLFRIDGGA